jgi:hypothetical protein
LNRFYRLFTTACVLLFSSVPAGAQDTYINAAETLAFGIFASEEVKTRVKGASDAAPPADSVGKYRFQEFTNKIPMIQGTEFGIEYQINSRPRGRPMDITTIIKFPEPGLKQPRGRTYLTSKETKKVKIGEPQLHGYGFDEDWELVAGEWVFEVWHKKAKLISKPFTIYDPNAD